MAGLRETMARELDFEAGPPQVLTSTGADAFRPRGAKARPLWTGVEEERDPNKRSCCTPFRLTVALPDDDGGSARCWPRVKFALFALLAAATVAAIVILSLVITADARRRGVEGGPDGGGDASGGASGLSPAPGAPKQSDEDGTLVVMAGPAPFTVPPGWTALWWDEFAGSSLDSKYWTADIGYGADYGLWAWGNQEQQYYKTSNVKVAGGQLALTALREETVLDDGYTFKYSSGRITTKGKLGVFGGMRTADGRKWDTVRIEAALQAPLPSPEGVWVSFWLLPVDLRYGVWATSGEIDIYEMINSFDNCNIALHFGGPAPKYKQRRGNYPPRPGGGSYASAMTKMTFDWSAASMRVAIQDKEQLFCQSRAAPPSPGGGTCKGGDGWYSDAIDAPPNAPYDIPFYFIINFSVGGKWPGNATERTNLPATFLVDYVRVLGKNS